MARLSTGRVWLSSTCGARARARQAQAWSAGSGGGRRWHSSASGQAARATAASAASRSPHQQQQPPPPRQPPSRRACTQRLELRSHTRTVLSADAVYTRSPRTSMAQMISVWPCARHTRGQRRREQSGGGHQRGPAAQVRARCQGRLQLQCLATQQMLLPSLRSSSRHHSQPGQQRQLAAAAAAAAATHVQDVAGAVVGPLEDRLRGGLRGALRQLDAVGGGPVHDGGAQRKVGGQLQVAQAHARHWARLVPLRQPPLDAVPVVRVPRGQDHRVRLLSVDGGVGGRCSRAVGCRWAAGASQR